MANPYATWVKLVRRTAQQAWTVARSNLANIGLDYVTSALETIMDLDAADGKLLSTVRAPGVTVGAVIDLPSSVESGTDENARRIIVVDLDDPDTIWDLDAFMQYIQATSWHTELGDPPIHGSMWITEAQDKVIWWNRETQTIYMTFTAGASNMFVGTLSCLAFLDGVIYCGSAGNHFRWADLLRDSGHAWTTSGTRRYKGDIADRDAGNNVYTPLATPSLKSGTINAVGVCRHVDLVDEFGRPLPWWVVGTATDATAYNPEDATIYDNAALTLVNDAMQVGAGGSMAWLYSNATRDTALWKRSIFTITADSWGGSPGYDDGWDNSFADAQELVWANSAVMSAMGLMEGESLAAVGSDMLIFGSELGLYIAHAHPAGSDTKGGLIRLHEDYVSPYMKGDIRGAWPLHSTADVAPGGHTLTNNNTVTFAAGGPTGNYADFVSASSMSLQLANHADLARIIHKNAVSLCTTGCFALR